MPKLQSDDTYIKEPVIGESPEYYGDIVDLLPPCLDPAPSKSGKKNADNSQRFCETEEMRSLNEDELTADLLYDRAPRSFAFYPSEAVMEKLLIKIDVVDRLPATKIQEQLWAGFHQMTVKNTDEVVQVENEKLQIPGIEPKQPKE